jgi:malate synthase
MDLRIERAGLGVDKALCAFVEEEALPGTGIEPARFWEAFTALVSGFTPLNRELLARRDEIQARIDEWCRAHPGQVADAAAYEAFLRSIGYIVARGPAFSATTRNVDPEIADIAGPQLVVPISNARFALNAANARWGSLYDALYGTDALGDMPPTGPYDPARGARVVAAAKAFLDDVVPLAGAKWAELVSIEAGAGLRLATARGETRLADATRYAGHAGSGGVRRVLLRNHGLGIEIVIDPAHPVGRLDPAGMADVNLEAALTAIMDCEDSVAAVDAADKIVVYRNWLGLMKGDLAETFEKGGRPVTRRMNADSMFVSPEGERFALRRTALMLIRHVGIHMRNPAILDRAGEEIFEGLMDAMIATAIALHDAGPAGRRANSRHGSIYVVKPKMHGPAEVAFVCDTFAQVERALGLAPATIKMGIMDEERRTTVNLAECIRAARDRVVFINTGFLDRTGDEIHTSMELGPVIRKGDIKQSLWIGAYENGNVDVGLACGLAGRAQIGKGMWAVPDRMAAMLEQKIGHPKAGANTAWVPSPTAATLHATHYHRVDVAAVQKGLAGRPPAKLSDILSPPVAIRPNWSDADIQAELDNNAQGILGYVVRWIDQGVGCSKVPDMSGVGLMEDRATLRISSQHIANWLRHGVVSRQRVLQTLQRMAVIVDRQNAADPAYRPMAPDFDASVAFAAACDLVFEGAKQPNGYTEPILHRRRREAKARRLA